MGSLLNLIPESVKRRATGALIILGALGWLAAAWYGRCTNAATSCCSSGICAEQGHHAASPAQYRHNGPVLLPDPAFTPGKARTGDKQQVCHGGSTKQYRHTTAAMKRIACLSYGLTDCPHQGKLELDHLIPLELGGADDIANLWPQPAEPKPGFHEKDLVENSLHAQVCSGAMELEDAQQQIAQDWYSVYLRMKGK